MKQTGRTRLVAIVGGSGAGKSWLADRLQDWFGDGADRLSLDDFYLDRSHLPVGQRSRLNYDHPRAIDWTAVRRVLLDCRYQRTTRLPRYDFATHTRDVAGGLWQPGTVVLVDGLWLLRPPAIRRLFDLTIFVECPPALRLLWRLRRDVAERGRRREAVLRQFLETVAPMHDQFVQPQIRRAHMVVHQPLRDTDLETLAAHVRTLLMKPANGVPRRLVSPASVSPTSSPKRTHHAHP
jgi:uridine kinase